MENEIIQKETTTFNNKLYDDLKNLLATVFVQNVIYWCGLNEKGKKQVVFADGIYWTSLNYDQICKSMPFEKGVSKKQLQRAIKLLTDKGYIMKKRKFNDNNWYAPTKKLREFLGEQQYDNLKNNYLNKNRSLHSLYLELNKDNTINRQLFFKLINKIRLEEGLEEYYTTKKAKRKNNIITFSDKSPNSYN